MDYTHTHGGFFHISTPRTLVEKEMSGEEPPLKDAKTILRAFQKSLASHNPRPRYIVLGQEANAICEGVYKQPYIIDDICFT